MSLRVRVCARPTMGRRSCSSASGRRKAARGLRCSPRPRRSCSPAKGRRASPTSPATCRRCSGWPPIPIPGLRDWLRIGPEAPTEALDRFAVDAGGGLTLLPVGHGRPRRPRRRRRAPRSRSRCGPIRARPSSTSGVLGAHPEPALHALRRGRRRERDRGARVLPGAAARGSRRAHRPGERRGVRRRGRPIARCPRRRERARCARSSRASACARRRRARSTPACCRPASPTRSPGRRAKCCGGSAASTAKRPRERVGVAGPPLREALHRRLLAAPFDPADPRARRAAVAARARCCATRRRWSPTRRPARVLDEIVAEVDGLGPLQSLLADPTISEIMVNGPNRVFVERNGAHRARSRAISTPTRSCASRSG